MAAVIAECLYLCGGFDEEALDSGECLHIPTGSWKPLPSMSAKRFYAGIATLDSCLYICGGANTADATILGCVSVARSTDVANSLSSAERFNPRSEAWEALPPMSYRRSGAIAAVAGRHLYMCGGCDASELNTVERL